MIKKSLIFFLVIILIENCSFDKKTGIWNSGVDEKKRISELEKKQKSILDVQRIYSSEATYSKKVTLNNSILLSKPKKNSSWKFMNLNLQNSFGNIYLPNVDKTFLKKKIGKNKFVSTAITIPLLVNENNVFLSDDTGTIFKLDQNGKISWKKNIYSKLYKRINKNLVLSIYKNHIYVVDNIGFAYSLSLTNGELRWIKNYGIPIKSDLKIFKGKIFFIDQDNSVVCISTTNGSKLWDNLSISSFIKSQNLLTLAISKNGYLLILNSSADLYRLDPNTGDIYWHANTLASMLPDATDFFTSSHVVINDDQIFFSAGSTFFSYDLESGLMNWENEVSSIGTPIIVGDNIFLNTKNGFYVIMKKNTGKIISSNNILEILKKSKRETKITGFIMGSGKVYSTTLNGYLITSSAKSGKVENFKKIGDPIISNPVISEGKLYILTENSKIFGFY